MHFPCIGKNLAITTTVSKKISTLLYNIDMYQYFCTPLIFNILSDKTYSDTGFRWKGQSRGVFSICWTEPDG